MANWNQNDYNIIVKTIKQIFKSEKVPLMKQATVNSVSAPNATVTIDGDTTSITIPNKTNQTLTIGNRVIVVLLNGDYTNAFIGFK